MTQTTIAMVDETGLPFRLHLNSGLETLATCFSGTTPPLTTYAYMNWLDTGQSPPYVKRRNSANSGWDSNLVVGGNLGVGGVTPAYTIDAFHATNCSIHAHGATHGAVIGASASRAYMGSFSNPIDILAVNTVRATVGKDAQTSEFVSAGNSYLLSRAENGYAVIGAVASGTNGAYVTLSDSTGELGRMRAEPGWVVFGNPAQTQELAINIATGDASYKGGKLEVVTPHGLGYGAGSGGTVTQLTSKTTSVTLNKPSGTIVTASSSIPANSTVSFGFTNSTLNWDDVVVINVYGSDTSLQYLPAVTEVSPGGCRVSLRNLSTESLGEVLYLRYVVIKGSSV